MMKYANFIGMVIGAVAGAIVFSLIEESSGLPWWFSHIGLIGGGIVGFIGGTKFAASRQD